MSPLLRLSAVAAAAEENESYEDQPEDVLIVEKIANAVSAVHKKPPIMFFGSVARSVNII